MPEGSSSGLAEIRAAFLRHHPGASIEIIEAAHRRAVVAHSGQTRKSGEAFITHPEAVTLILAAYGLDADTLAAALLHDTVEDTDLTIDAIEAEFGSSVASLIDGVTKLDRIRYGSQEQAQAATIRKMVVAMAQDVRVLLIKLTDRLHNVRTIAALRPEKQERIARETLDIYAPLAHRLGVQEVKHELEDRCFAILYPGPFAEIEAKLAQRAPERDIFIEKVTQEVAGVLAEAGIEARVTGRPKHHYSIYRKMVESAQPFEEIHDLIGIRIVVPEVRDCYAALGLIHTMRVPVQGRFKDYVAMPKFNLYQSLHTTVIGPDGRPLEVQIRTVEMNRMAESGIAAHWRYKEGTEAAALPWMKEVRFLQEEFADPEEFLAQLKLDLYQDEVFVLTPKGDARGLPRGATAVDFAYMIHTEVGNRCVGARINGRLMPLATKLASGDIVEVITSKSQDSGPSRDWLAFVRTSRAKAKIRQWFQKERRDAALGEGREQVAVQLRREGLGLGASERDRLLVQIAEDLGKPDLESLYVSVGDGSIAATTVVGRLVRLVRPEGEEEDLLAPPRRRTPATGGPGIIVEGLDDMLVRVARCCAPVPGDPIVGFVTVGRGVSVHRSDCTNIRALGDYRERMVEVTWSPERVGRFAVWVQVEALDRTRLLRDVTAAISDLGGNITASSSVTGRDRVAVLRYEVELSDPAQVGRLLAELKGVDGVFATYRLAADPAGGTDQR